MLRWHGDHLSISGTCETTHHLEAMASAILAFRRCLPSTREAVADDLGLETKERPLAEQMAEFFGYREELIAKAAAGGHGVDLSKMSEDEIRERLLGALGIETRSATDSEAGVARKGESPTRRVTPRIPHRTPGK